MKMRIEEGKPLNLNDQLNAISMGLLPNPEIWPTPRANRGNGDGIHGLGGLDLQTAVQMWPTPRAGNPGSRPKRNGGRVLSEEVKKSTQTWQTPTVEDAGRKGSANGWLEYLFNGKTSQCRLRNQVQMFPTPTVQDYKHRGPNSKQQGLADAVRLWATPTVNDAKNTLTESQRNRRTLTAHLIETGEIAKGQLNADWVEALMGYPLFWTDINKESSMVSLYPVAWINGTWEENIPRIITGQKLRIKRLKCLGNSVVPQIPMILWLFVAMYIFGDIA